MIDEIDQEIFAVLTSMGDFLEFRELMAAHKSGRAEEKAGDKIELEVIGKPL